MACANISISNCRNANSSRTSHIDMVQGHDSPLPLPFGNPKNGGVDFNFEGSLEPGAWSVEVKRKSYRL
jgi:hypothetical protein